MWQIGVSTLLNRLKQSIASANVRASLLSLSSEADNITGLREFPQEAIYTRRTALVWSQEAMSRHGRE